MSFEGMTKREALAELQNLRTTAAEDLRMIRKLEAERDALAAVIEQLHREPDRVGHILGEFDGDTDAALREVRGQAWDKGREESGELRWDGTRYLVKWITDVPNPYREANDG